MQTENCCQKLIFYLQSLTGLLGQKWRTGSFCCRQERGKWVTWSRARCCCFSVIITSRPTSCVASRLFFFLCCFFLSFMGSLCRVWCTLSDCCNHWIQSFITKMWTINQEKWGDRSLASLGWLHKVPIGSWVDRFFFFFFPSLSWFHVVTPFLQRRFSKVWKNSFLQSFFFLHYLKIQKRLPNISDCDLISWNSVSVLLIFRKNVLYQKEQSIINSWAVLKTMGFDKKLEKNEIQPKIWVPTLNRRPFCCVLACFMQIHKPEIEKNLKGATYWAWKKQTIPNLEEKLGVTPMHSS